jgi:repressor LexA
MPQARPLTPRQMQILDFIIDHIQELGYGPTVREIVRHVGDKSPTSVHRHLRTLESRGHISRGANKSRAISLTAAHRGLLLSGVIAAGSPIEAIKEVEQVDLAVIYDRANHFMLKVRGDLMIEDHINDGDLIVVRRQSTCDDGDTVVALIDGENATLKRFYREEDSVRLQPANRNLEPVFVSTHRVSIDGVMVGVVRQVAASPMT